MKESDAKGGQEKRPVMAERDDDWSREVIAAAFKAKSISEHCLTSSMECMMLPEDGPLEEDEGIASDDSMPVMSSNDSSKAASPTVSSSSGCSDSPKLNNAPTSQHHKKTLRKRPKSSIYISEVGGYDKTANQRNFVGFLRQLVLSKTKDPSDSPRVFGRDLISHMRDTQQQVPMVVRVCAKCIESHGMVDGIYRLSGISSNIRALKMAFETTCSVSAWSEMDQYGDFESDFDWKKFPMLRGVGDKERSKPDVHSISSLLKLYFRELPEPLCTYKLYDKFLETAKMQDELKLVAVREVVQQLPQEHYRTLEYLMRHLYVVSEKGHQTGMTSKNLSIVWAPNLLRCSEDSLKSAGSTNHLKDIGLQAVCTEFLIRYPDLIFAKCLPTFASQTFELGIVTLGNEIEIDIDKEIAKRNTPSSDFVRARWTNQRPKSLAISTPSSILLNESSQQFMEVGGGPRALPTKYHTIVDLASSPTANGRSPQPLATNLKSRLFTFPTKTPSCAYSAATKNVNFRRTMLSDKIKAEKKKNRMAHSISFFDNGHLKMEPSQTIPSKLFASESIRSEQNLIRKMPYKSVESLLYRQRRDGHGFVRYRPHSTSSDEASETDVAGEVNDLRLSFDQEESEIRMMNCCMEDDLVSSETSGNESSSYGDIKSHSSLAKMSLCMMQTQPDSWEAVKATLTEIANRCTSDDEADQPNEQKGGTAHLPKAKSHKKRFDSFRQLKLRVNHVFAMKTYKKNTDKETESGKSGIAAEAVPPLPAESDTNKSSSDPNMYGTTATEGGRAGCSSSIMSPIAEELADQSAALLDLQVSVNSINYEDVQTLTTHHIISGHNKQECKMMAGSRENVMEAAAQDHYQSPVVGPEPSVDHTSPHVYENCDFQEDAVYQNVVVDRTGRLVPITSGTVKATNTENDDVYSQVRFLRKSVQEINALVEKEKQRHFVTEKTLVMNRPTTVSHQDLVHMKRSHQFKDILSKFNSASDSGVATPKSAPKS